MISNPGGLSAAQVQALIDAALAGKFGTASVAVTGGGSGPVTLSHGFGLFASGISAAYTGLGIFTITKSAPFTPTGDARDYAVTVTLADNAIALITTVQKANDSEFIVRVWAMDGTTPTDPVDPFTLSIQSIAPPP